MKKIALLTALAGIFAFNVASEHKRLSLGEVAPMQKEKMKDVSGKEFSLADVKKENGLLVIFSCNTCPFVLGWEDQFAMLNTIGMRNKIGMILVNSNETKRKDEDSPAEMLKHYTNANYDWPYVIDEKSKLANAFGANTTPHVFLFDGDMKLVFTGSINDKYEQKDKVATQPWLTDAMAKLGIGDAKGINPKETKNIGCSIKRE